MIPKTGSEIAFWHSGRFDPALQPGLAPVLLPGSFNPLHRGHERLRQTAELLTGQPVIFELSVANVDKGTMSAEELRQRLLQFSGHTVAVTAAPTFHAKAQLFPGATFVLGIDTAERLLSPRYTGDDPRRLGKQLRHMQVHGIRFLVAGRVTLNGTFRTLASLELPPAFAGMWRDIPESLFREDVSSSAIRASRSGEDRPVEKHTGGVAAPPPGIADAESP